MAPIRVQITDSFGNLYYLYQDRDGRWDMMLANGIPYSMSGLFRNAALTKFALQDAGGNPDAILTAVKSQLKHDCPVKIIGQSAITSKGMLTDEQKEDFAWILTETIDLSVDRRAGLKPEEAKREFESVKRVLDYLETKGVDMSVQRRALGTPRF